MSDRMRIFWKGLFTGTLNADEADFPELKFTWNDGFRVAVSGTLTNQYVAANLGLGVTLGLNVGYDFDALQPVHPDGSAAKDDEGFALDSSGSRIQDAVSGTFAKFDDLFGFQLYGFADGEVFGVDLVRAGMLLDFSDPINPVFNIGASLPGSPSLLTLLLPANGNIGLQLRSDGYVEGSILSTIAFLEGATANAGDFFHDVLIQIGEAPTEDAASPLGTLANRLEADRRHFQNIGNCHGPGR